MSALHPRLRVFAILGGAMTFPWQHRAALFRVIAVPLLAVTAVHFAWDVIELDEYGAGLWTLYFVDAIVTSWLAIAIHRLVLLEASVAQPGLESNDLRRLGVFVGTLIGTWLIFAALARTLELAATQSVAEIFEEPAGSAMNRVHGLAAVAGVVFVAVFWFSARMSLLFPAIAVDRGFDPAAAWRLSRGNSLRLMVIVCLFPVLIATAIVLLYQEDASVADLLVISMLSALLLIVEVAALSLTYQQLTSPAPPPTDPPD